MAHKKMDKGSRNRLITVIVILLIDVLFMPWLLKFPTFLVKDLSNAPSKWFSYGMFNSYKDVFSDTRFLKLLLTMQLPVVAMIIYVIWNTEKLKKKNRIKDGVGGPEPAGQGQHGTSRWQDIREMDSTATVWYSDTPLKAGGSND